MDVYFNPVACDLVPFWCLKGPAKKEPAAKENARRVAEICVTEHERKEANLVP